jgi:hypothetical protein
MRVRRATVIVICIGFGNQGKKYITINPHIFEKGGRKIMQALFTLTSSESKRLLGKAVAALPEVQHAKDHGYLVMGRGTTNAFIIEELMNSKMDKERYVAGQIIKGVLCVLGPDLRNKPVTFHQGELQAVEPGSVIDKLVPGDILIKGANAVDPFGNVGVLMAGPGGGTMGQFYMGLKAQGVATIYPVGLEKLIPSVVGMACVADGRVITEIEAIDSLFGLKAVHYASGGWGGTEGSVTLLVEGEDDDVNTCLDMIEGIKGEPPLTAAKSPCKTCGAPCSFQGKELADLPGYLK